MTWRPLAAAVAVTLLVAAAIAHEARAAQFSPVTYSKDIAPILFTKCSACHHPGGSAPFSVLSYGAVRQFATPIALATRRGLMPPWKADPDVSGDFIGQTRVSPAEIDLIERWAAEGAPEGDRAALPAIPKWTDGWQLGTPDLVVSTPNYTLRAEGTDVFRIFVVPLPVNALKFVRGIEFLPGNLRAVHHANIRLDETRASRQFDEADPAPGYDGLIAPSATYPDGFFLGWTPGQVSPLMRKGLSWRLRPGTDLVVELHMPTSGKVEEVISSIGFYFTSDPPTLTPSMLRLGRQGIDIAAGDPRYTITDQYVLPVDVEVQAVQPHAHFRAREMTGTATLPDGSTRSLIEIRDWDFRWQHVYRYVTPFSLPKGTTLTMRYTYDNSADNPRNPVVPPQRVYWGQRSSDEMGDLWIQVLTRSERDLGLLNDEFGAKVMAEDVIGYERWIQSDPTTVALHDDVAILYLKLNRPNDAVRHFAIAAASRPNVAASHFNLGLALTMAGQIPAAVSQYRKAIDLRPDYPQAHNNLGGVLLKTGKLEEAVGHLSEAVRLDPVNVQALYNSGMAMRELGRGDEAIGFFRRALAIGPNLPGPLAGLAWLLATSGEARLRDPAQAVRLGERAVSLTEGHDPVILDTLAAAYASAGNFTRAVETADAALRLAPTNAEEVAARRALYAVGTPYRIPN